MGMTLRLRLRPTFWAPKCTVAVEKGAQNDAAAMATFRYGFESGLAA
jgi:hypothetical protein